MVNYSPELELQLHQYTTFIRLESMFGCPSPDFEVIHAIAVHRATAALEAAKDELSEKDMWILINGESE